MRSAWQEREWIQLDCDGPAGEGPLEENTDQAVLALLDPALGEGGLFGRVGGGTFQAIRARLPGSLRD
jgi:hypothetical protein